MNVYSERERLASGMSKRLMSKTRHRRSHRSKSIACSRDRLIPHCASRSYWGRPEPETSYNMNPITDTRTSMNFFHYVISSILFCASWRQVFRSVLLSQLYYLMVRISLDGKATSSIGRCKRGSSLARQKPIPCRRISLFGAAEIWAMAPSRFQRA